VLVTLHIPPYRWIAEVSVTKAHVTPNIPPYRWIDEVTVRKTIKTVTNTPIPVYRRETRYEYPYTVV